WETRRFKWVMNLHPAYRGMGGVVTYIASDWQEVHVKLPLNLFTNNYVGTLFGGSLYGCIDPLYMLMLIKILGRDYIVWDKAATIQFKKPGSETLYARFHIPDDEIAAIKRDAAGGEALNRVYPVQLVDKAGTVHVHVDKTLYIKQKQV
ncbi:MAG: DUF4442 domain-containing protein, partial [Aggregatilineales bacterium]